MRREMKEYLKQYTREEQKLLNKSEIARIFNCDPRAIDRPRVGKTPYRLDSFLLSIL